MSYYIGIYWGARREDRETCARRIAAMASELAKLDDQFVDWFLVGQSRKKALNRPFLVDIENVSHLLEECTNRRDSDKTPMPELGFRLALWNGAADRQSVAFSVQCGLYSPLLKNAVILNLPAEGEKLRNLLNFEKMSKVLSVLVGHFMPEGGTVNKPHLRDNIIGISANAPQVGWITFLSKEIFGKIPLSPDYEIIASDIGSMIVATRDVFSLENANHLKSALAVANVVSQRLKLPLVVGSHQYHS